MNRTGLVIFLIAGLLFSFSRSYSQTSDSNEIAEGFEVGNLAPHFSLEDFSENRVFLENFKGNKVILLVFCRCDSEACVYGISGLKELHKNFKDSGLEILAVNNGEAKSSVLEFIKNYEIPYNVLLDLEGSVAELYGVDSFPVNILIDTDGKILYRDIHVPSIEFIAGYCNVKYRSLYFTVGEPKGETDTFDISPKGATINF